jgi:hypothetical protein
MRVSRLFQLLLSHNLWAEAAAAVAEVAAEAYYFKRQKSEPEERIK